MIGCCYLRRRAEAQRLQRSHPDLVLADIVPLAGRISGGSLSGHAAAASRVQRNSVPSAQMRCMTMANLRATATTARRMPRGTRSNTSSAHFQMAR